MFERQPAEQTDYTNCQYSTETPAIPVFFAKLLKFSHIYQNFPDFIEICKKTEGDIAVFFIIFLPLSF